MGGAGRPVVVVGGGVIGLSIALRLAEDAFDVTLVDPTPGHGTSWAAGGMLSPAAEVAPGEERLLEDLCAAAALWPAFARRVSDASSLEVGYEATGSILVAHGPSDAREATRTVELIRRVGLSVDPLSASALSSLEPSLEGGLRGGWLLPGDHRVDNRLLLDALVAGVKALGVRIIEDRCVRIDRSADHLRCELEHQGDLTGERCVVATGAAPFPAGLEGLGLPVVRPVRGMTLRLGAVDGVVVPTRTIRAIADGVHCYVVPRADGSVVLGATTEEQGWLERARAGGVHQLLDAARRVYPGIDELTFEEAAVGLRPVTGDQLPFVAPLSDARVLAAVGHYRNGLLLAPLSAERVLRLVGEM